MVINASCASLMNPQEQPVKVIDGKANIYLTTCSGMAETIGTCYMKAKRTCGNKYKLLDERLDSNGIHREIKFQCN